MSSTIIKSAFLLIALGAGATVPNAALASSGNVRGYLRFYQNQGNYCPSNRNCTGAKYLESQYNENRPLKNVKIYIQKSTGGPFIGSGTTSSSGYFNVSWSSPSDSGAVTAKVLIRYEHKDNRFRILTALGNPRPNTTTTFSMDDGRTTYIGTKTFGSSTAPNSIANLYDGAHMMWANSLSQTNRMHNYFNNVQIRAFDASTCPTSCANGPNNRITIDSVNSAYMPQARVMHEMGHIASYRASRDQQYLQAAQYCYPNNTGSGCGWTYTSEEWASARFEEAVATHLADVALYHDFAVEPNSCIGSGVCFNDLENGGSCSSDDPREVLSAMRYFWDNYDDSNDGETLSRGVWHVVDTIHAFDNGSSNRDKNEVWNSSLSQVDDRDGRSVKDFLENWKIWGTDSTASYDQNCASEGD